MAVHTVGANSLRVVSGVAISRQRAETLSRVLGPAYVLAGVNAAGTGTKRRRRARYITAQFCHESARFTTIEEFASGAAYEGRRDLGNIHEGDGVRFKGGGFIQVTGRANYRRVTAWVRED